MLANLRGSLEETQVWIASGGVAAPVVMAPLQNLPPTNPTLPAPSDGESEVGASDEELPDPQRLLSKVRRSDESSMCWTRVLGL